MYGVARELTLVNFFSDCGGNNAILFVCLWGMALVLSEATFDQLVELPGVGRSNFDN